MLPAASSVFYGRDQEVKYVESFLLRPEGAAIAILGSGGIGKTSLALSVMHRPDIAKHYARRYFIACDAANTPADVFERFAVLQSPAASDSRSDVVCIYLFTPRRSHPSRRVSTYILLPRSSVIDRRFLTLTDKILHPTR